MANKLSIRKGATVQVIAGADRGKKGKVVEVDPKKMRVKVEGIRVQTHYDKKDGLKKIEGFLDYSNVKLLEGAPAKTGGKKTTSKKKTASKSA